jgi:hypothetical protein
LKASKLYKSYKERKFAIQQKKLQNLKEKEKAIIEAKEKNFKKMEKFTSDVMFYGLWQNGEEVDKKLSEISKKK